MRRALYSNTVIDALAVDSEEGTGRDHSPPKPLLGVPNVTAHPSTAVYQLHIIRCGTINGQEACILSVYASSLDVP